MFKHEIKFGKTYNPLPKKNRNIVRILYSEIEKKIKQYLNTRFGTLEKSNFRKRNQRKPFLNHPPLKKQKKELYVNKNVFPEDF